MTTLQAVGLQRNTLEIMDNFFPMIKKLDINDRTNYQMDLARCVKTFFEEMNQVGKKEFASFLKNINLRILMLVNNKNTPMLLIV